MLVSVATGVGLKHKIREKIAAFQGHLQITNYDNNNSAITLNPVSVKQDFYPVFKTLTGVKNVHVFATKAGIIRTEKAFEGVIFKGISSDYDWSFFKQYLVGGRLLKFGTEASNKVLISSTIANRMNLKIGDKFNVYFIKDDPNNAPNLRVLQVEGIYNTAFNEFDENYIWAI